MQYTCLVGCRLPPLNGYVAECLVLTKEFYASAFICPNDLVTQDSIHNFYAVLFSVYPRNQIQHKLNLSSCLLVVKETKINKNESGVGPCIINCSWNITILYYFSFIFVFSNKHYKFYNNDM